MGWGGDGVKGWDGEGLVWKGWGGEGLVGKGWGGVGMVWRGGVGRDEMESGGMGRGGLGCGEHHRQTLTEKGKNDSSTLPFTASQPTGAHTCRTWSLWPSFSLT